MPFPGLGAEELPEGAAHPLASPASANNSASSERILRSETSRMEPLNPPKNVQRSTSNFERSTLEVERWPFSRFLGGALGSGGSDFMQFQVKTKSQFNGFAQGGEGGLVRIGSVNWLGLGIPRSVLECVRCCAAFATTPIAKRQGTGALQDASRGSNNSYPRVSP